LSIIVPTYNGAAYLTQALQSIVAQGVEDIEVIAIDDGSTDWTVHVLKSFRHVLPLKIIERAHQGNWVTSTNDGLHRASGLYACILHQDDLWSGGRLSHLRRRLDQSPKATLFLHPAVYVDERGNHLGLWNCPLPRGKEFLEPATVYERLLVQNYLAVSAPLFSRRLALDVGGLDEQLWYTADWDFWLNLVAASTEIGYCSEPLCGFRIHAQSQTIERSGAADMFRRQLEVVLDRHLAKSRFFANDSLRRVAEFSVDVNVALAGWIHGARPPFIRLALEWLRLGPAGWRRYLRDSRIFERTAARLRTTAGKTPAAGRNGEQGGERSPVEQELLDIAGKNY
jgi:glycosyltransferase involved in cell wall biosynthesis